MKTFTAFLIIALLHAPQSHAQTIQKKDSNSISKEWGTMHELVQLSITKLKAKIQEALLEPDLCLHRPAGAFSKEKETVTPIKKLRAELAQTYKHRDTIDTEYMEKLKALADKD